MRAHAVRTHAETPMDFRRLFDRLPIPVWVFDAATLRFLAVNDAALRRYGYTREEFLAMTIERIRPRGERSRFRHAVRAKGGVMAGPYQGEWTHRARNGDLFDVEVYGVTVTFGGRPARLTCAVDVSARNRVSAESAARLRESHDRLRHLAARARARREEDRTRIARELHDQLGQALAGLKMDLHALREQSAPAPAVLGRIAAMDALVDDTIAGVRRIASELRPPVLDKLGLRAAIAWQLEDFSRRTGIRVPVRSRGPALALDPGRATAIFRIFQEALSNVASHGRATEVKVALSSARGRFACTVEDNGVGVRREDVARADALGIVGMRERAHLLGGTVDVRPRRPRGTTVKIVIPLADRRRTPRGERP